MIATSTTTRDVQVARAAFARKFDESAVTCMQGDLSAQIPRACVVFIWKTRTGQNTTNRYTDLQQRSFKQGELTMAVQCKNLENAKVSVMKAPRVAYHGIKSRIVNTDARLLSRRQYVSSVVVAARYQILDAFFICHAIVVNQVSACHA